MPDLEMSWLPGPRSPTWARCARAPAQWSSPEMAALFRRGGALLPGFSVVREPQRSLPPVSIPLGPNLGARWPIPCPPSSLPLSREFPAPRVPKSSPHGGFGAPLVGGTLPPEVTPGLAEDEEKTLAPSPVPAGPAPARKGARRPTMPRTIRLFQSVFPAGLAGPPPWRICFLSLETSALKPAPWRLSPDFHLLASPWDAAPPFPWANGPGK